MKILVVENQPCSMGVSALRSRIGMILDLAYFFNYAKTLEDTSEV